MTSSACLRGLTGQIHLCAAGEQTAFETHCKSIVEALVPVGGLELDLAQSIAVDQWRLQRVRAIETGIFALDQQDRVDPINEALSRAQTWLEKAGDIQRLAVYEERINRSIERNMAELRTLRAERKAARSRALEEAQLLARLADNMGERTNVQPISSRKGSEPGRVLPFSRRF